MKYLSLERVRLEELENNIDTEDMYGLTPLHRAIIKGNVPEVDELIKRGADLNILFRGMSALQLAVFSKNTEVVKILVKQGIINARASNGSTALHTAAEKNNIETIRLLITAGIDVKAQTNLGATALHAAATCDNSAAIEELIKVKDININDIDFQGYTALHYATMQNNNSAIITLLKNGASLYVMNEFNETPLDILIENKQTEKLAEALVQIPEDNIAKSITEIIKKGSGWFIDKQSHWKIVEKTIEEAQKKGDPDLLAAIISDVLKEEHTTSRRNRILNSLDKDIRKKVYEAVPRTMLQKIENLIFGKQVPETGNDKSSFVKQLKDRRAKSTQNITM